jgi:hypothetical protein
LEKLNDFPVHITLSIKQNFITVGNLEKGGGFVFVMYNNNNNIAFCPKQVGVG